MGRGCVGKPRCAPSSTHHGVVPPGGNKSEAEGDARAVVVVPRGADLGAVSPTEEDAEEGTDGEGAGLGHCGVDNVGAGGGAALRAQRGGGLRC